MKTSLTCLAVLLAVSAHYPAAAQSPQGNDRQAQADYQAGVAARAKGDSRGAAAEFRKAIEFDSTFIEAHIAYIDASLSAALVSGQRAGEDGQLPAMKPLVEYYQKRAANDKGLTGVAKLARALGYDPRFEAGAQVAHLLIGACAAEPQVVPYLIDAARRLRDSNPQRALAYARGLRSSNETEYVETLNYIVAHNPKQLVALSALRTLAAEAPAATEKKAALEEIRGDFGQYAHFRKAAHISDMYAPDAQYDAAMHALFAIYVNDGDPRAGPLADAMAKANPGDRAWAASALFQQMLAPWTLDVMREAGDSRALVDATRIQLELLQARVLGDPPEAYASLLNGYSETPAESLKSALYEAGAKAHKTRPQIDDDLWQARNRDAKPFRPFELSTYDGKQIRSSDFRGRVVLVTFWFPTCAACLVEFPYFQQVVDRVGRGNHFALLAINGLPEQDNLVQPLFARMKLSFTALKASNAAWVKNYNVSSFPTNFLLDAQGRVIYSGFTLRGEEDLKLLNSRVDQLLAHLSAAPG
jgi:thiol-disulfide isomerase/thioredoxin